MRSWIVMLIAMLWIWPFAGNAAAEEPNQTNPPLQSSAPAAKPAGGQPDAFFPQASHTFEAVLEGAVVMHSFVLKNRGDAVLDVKEVKTS